MANFSSIFPKKRIIFILCSILSFLLGFSCSTTDNMTKEVAVPADKPTHYTLRLGDAVNHQKPLPAYRPILIDWHYKNGAVKTAMGYHGWDFNQDGRLDMVEVLKENGETNTYVFDFDFDGEIDMTQQLK